MATRKSGDDDAHNPFGPDPEVPKRGPEPGVFDPKRESENDPFKPSHNDKDAEWDETDDGKSTRDV